MRERSRWAMNLLENFWILWNFVFFFFSKQWSFLSTFLFPVLILMYVSLTLALEEKEEKQY